MSVILNALRSQKEDEKPAGLIMGEPGPASSGPSGPSSKRTLFLAIALGGAVIFSVAVWWIEKSVTVDSHIQPVPVATEVAPPTPVEGSEAPAVPAVPTAPEQDYAKEGQTQFAAGNWDASLVAYQKAIEKDSKNAQLYNDLGMVFLKKELYSSAASYFSKALEYNDKCGVCFNNLGFLKTLLNEPLEAERYLQKAIALDPKYPDPYFNLGVLYEKNGDVAKAIRSYQDFLARQPKEEIAKKVKTHVQELSGQ